MNSKKQELYNLLKLDEKKARVAAIQKMMATPDFWRDQERARMLTQELGDLGKVIEQWEKAETDEEISKLETQTLFSGQYDSDNALVSMHAGAGGTEAMDWAEMLVRMYRRWAEKKGFRITILSISAGEEAGIKSATMRVEGLNAYGYLKGEAGVHRLVRISPFDADKARHTSFALVEVIPEFRQAGDVVKIDEKDLRIDVYRAGGHGGQGVNTTDSAVRITHIPTGIVVSCQNERSQIQNRETATKVLQARLYQLKLSQEQEVKKELRGEFKSAEWGNQIRSYVLHPYQMVKDHRTDYETSDTEGVLGGEIDEFIESYLKSQK